MSVWQLIINGPGYFDTSYDLPDGVTQVGRADENDVVLSGDLVSRRHARFHVSGAQVTVEDLGSRNGSQLNGERFTGTATVAPGDVVGVGENRLELRQPAVAESMATEMVDTGGGGRVRRFGHGVAVDEALMMARDLNAPSPLKDLDDLLPFERSAGGAGAPTPTDTDENDDTAEAHPDAAAWRSLVLLYRVTEALARAQRLEDFLDVTTDLVMRRVGATTGVVLLRHPTGVMVPAAVRHQTSLARGEVPVSDAIIDTALSRGQAVAVADVRDDSRFRERESVVLYGADQVLCIPIGGVQPFAGVLYLNRPSVDGEALETLLDLCTAITQLMQSGIERFGSPTASAGDDKLRRSLERFHAPEAVERRLGELRQLGGAPAGLAAKPVTVLTVELAGLDAQTGALPPERSLELLDAFARVAVQLVFSFDGAIVTLSGDALTAVFGAPWNRGDDAIRAVRAAMALRAEWERQAQQRPTRERQGVRLGLNTARALVGLVGGEARLDFVAVGEGVRLARLLCASAEPGQVLITGKTLAAVGARFDVTPLGERQLAPAHRTAVFEVVEEDLDSGTLSGVR